MGCRTEIIRRDEDAHPQGFYWYAVCHDCPWTGPERWTESDAIGDMMRHQMTNVKRRTV